MWSCFRLPDQQYFLARTPKVSKTKPKVQNTLFITYIPCIQLNRKAHHCTSLKNKPMDFRIVYHIERKMQKWYSSYLTLNLLIECQGQKFERGYLFERSNTFIYVCGKNRESKKIYADHINKRELNETQNEECACK